MIKFTLIRQSPAPSAKNHAETVTQFLEYKNALAVLYGKGTKRTVDMITPAVWMTACAQFRRSPMIESPTTNHTAAGAPN